MPGKDLWISAEDLARAANLQIKPEGICSAQTCFPLPKGKEGDFIAQKDQTTWFNLSEFARLIHLPVAEDAKNGVWLFGPRPDSQNAFLKTLQAPDFTLPDANAVLHSLSDYRGKKVLLITWASW
jgi:hypothetical protein